MLKMELKKAFCNNLFIVSFGIAIIIAVISAVQAIKFYLIQMFFIEKYEPNVHTYFGSSLYNNWIGASGDFFTHLFYFLIFLLCTLPYSWSLIVEKKSGYINQIVTRTSREKYYVYKYIAAFISGGIIAAIPMILNLLICALYIPAYPMDQLSDLYIAVPQSFLWSSVLYESPMIYVLLYILLSYIMCGLWSTIGISLAFILKNKLSVLISPFLFVVFIQVLSNYSFNNSGKTIIPSYLIAPRAYGYGNTSGSVVVIWIVIILIFNIVVYYIKGRKTDVI